MRMGGPAGGRTVRRAAGQARPRARPFYDADGRAARRRPPAGGTVAYSTSAA